MADSGRGKNLFKHGGWGTRLYHIYRKMLERCTNPNYSEHIYYYDRGISICSEWRKDFKAFRDWALNNGYEDHLSIDRIDVNKGYSPENCRWADAKTQSRNRRSNIRIALNGIEKTLVEWCEELELPYKTIEMRILRGWNPQKALTEKINTNYRKKL